MGGPEEDLWVGFLALRRAFGFGVQAGRRQSASGAAGSSWNMLKDRSCVSVRGLGVGSIERFRMFSLWACVVVATAVVVRSIGVTEA